MQPKIIFNNSPFCSFGSFFIVSLTPFINKPDSSSILTILIIPVISSLEIVNVVVPDPDVF